MSWQHILADGSKTMKSQLITIEQSLLLEASNETFETQLHIMLHCSDQLHSFVAIQIVAIDQKNTFDTWNLMRMKQRKIKKFDEGDLIWPWETISKIKKTLQKYIEGKQLSRSINEKY